MGSEYRLAPSALWLAALFAASLPSMVTAPANGVVTSAKKFPFVVGLFDQLVDPREGQNFIPFCSGVILTSSFVLTTSSCLLRSTDNGNRYNRRSEIQPINTIVLYGSTYSPSYDKKNGNYYPHWNWDPDKSKVPPNARQEKDLYDVRKGKKFHFPDKSDLADAFKDDENLEQILKEGNAYNDYWKRLDDTPYLRFHLDFAVIELDGEIIWSEAALPAVFPLQSAPLTRVWWETAVKDEMSGKEKFRSCYVIGWGSWVLPKNRDEFKQVRLRQSEVKFVPYENCNLSYCNECSYCNSTYHVKEEIQACYKSVYQGDACLEDEGGPVWCEWAGTSFKSGGKYISTGAVLGILGNFGSCPMKYRYDDWTSYKNIPSVYFNSWQAYGLISRATGYVFPPSLFVYKDIIRRKQNAKSTL